VFSTIPWLAEGYSWCGSIGIALGMALAIQGGWGSSFWVMWFWCSCSLAAAFHWSPAAMAYTLSSEFWVGLAVATPLFVWDGLRMALGFWLAAKLTRDVRFYWLAAASTSIALEFVMPGVFPWKLGMTLLSSPWLVQGVEVFGAGFSTFVAFAIAGGVQNVANGFYCWFTAGSERTPCVQLITSCGAWWRLVSTPVFIAILCIGFYNYVAWNKWSDLDAASTKVRLGVIQVDPSYVESTSNSREQTELIAANVDLMCWPESSAGTYDLRLNSLADDDRTFQLSREPERGLRPWPTPRCELLVGGKNYVGEGEEPEQLFVTAMLIDTEENIRARHNKRFLMPFGEYVPFENYVPGLAALFDMAERVEPGSTAAPIESQCGAKIGAMLCYEDMVPKAARDMVNNGSNLLVSLINGSAFESHFTLYQHRLISHMRAIECRRYFVRCAATGESCSINPLGQIETRLPMQANGAMVASVGLLSDKTFYCRFPWVLPVVVASVLITFLTRRQTSKRKL